MGCKATTADEYLSRGDRAIKAGQLTDAEKDYQAALALAPENSRAHLALARLYGLEHKPELATQEQAFLADLEPKNPAGHVAKAKLYVGQSQWPLAEEQYRAAIMLDPSNPNDHLELGSVLADENKPAEAEAELRTALGLDSKSARAHFALANLLNSAPGRQQEAEAEYEQARALDPSLVPAAPPASPATSTAAGKLKTTLVKTKAHKTKAHKSRVYKTKPFNDRFLLTRNSHVYGSPTPRSHVVALVHKDKYVRVTGISGDWLRVRLRTGTVGFIPVSAVE